MSVSILFHCPCTDGAFSAYSAHLAIKLKLEQEKGNLPKIIE